MNMAPPWVIFLTEMAVMLPILSVGIVVGLAAHAWSRAGRLGAAIRPMISGVGGGVIGYFAGAWVACRWLWPASNTCGLAAVFVSAPLAAIIGAWIGWRPARGATGSTNASPPIR